MTRSLSDAEAEDGNSDDNDDNDTSEDVDDDSAFSDLLAQVAATPAVHVAGDRDLLIGRRLGRFIVTTRLGRGGMGVVYRARDPELRRDVAIKVLAPDAARDPDRRQRFLREARAAAALSHPTIATLYDVGTDDGDLAYFAMELIDGVELRARLRAGPLPAAEVERIAVQVARGLARAHAQSIVHRDLKPENIMITRDGDVKILDFGLAKNLNPAERDGASTANGVVQGTPGYMAPEQVRAERADARADVFAFGVIVFEMLTGKAPFTGPTPMATALSVTVDPVPPVHRTDAPLLVGLVGRCLEKDRERRPKDGAALVDALSAGPVTSTAPASTAPASTSSSSTAPASTAPASTSSAGPFAPTMSARATPLVAASARAPRVAVGIAAAVVLAAFVGAFALGAFTR